ncbi:Interferon-inducible GTPase 1 [Trichoderma lentiforme]|uniref:Interferon-inducible GTPase 1 n=1 Tax=Trichoderma lentiforme TaxID=1567552 RepID=A0A9P4XE69_9HYPO|nr:Interferon-inducible GTPase 1 [Trichoderma lentiforme]
MAWIPLIPGAAAGLWKGYEEIVARPQRRAREAQQKLRESQEKERESEQRRLALLKELGYDTDQPTITEDLILSAQETLGYGKGKQNIVFAGNVNVGKSSLINALCNKGGNDNGAARVGSNQVTMGITRHEIPNHPEMLLYDIPGAGTQDVPAFQYYHDQMLYAFDTVVLVHDTTLTQADIRLLKMCILSSQKCLAVRTKSDGHIRNYEYDKECNNLEEARQIFLSEVREDIERCQERIAASWPEREVQVRDYVVSSRSMRSFMRQNASPKDPATAYIDELDFAFALSPTLVVNVDN